jgi:uncharacterized protein (TIGR03083 family)
VTGPPWDHLRYCDAVAAEIARFADVVRGADPATPVITCPGWTVGQLLKHMGRVHRWAGAMVRDLAPRRYGKGDFELDPPERAEDYPEWVAAGAAPLVAALRAADPAAPVWAWGTDPHVRWWARRMLHETTVHRADAELALGRVPRIAADVAIDGVAEFFDILSSAASFSPNVEKLRGDGETIGLTAADEDTSWLVTVGPDGPAAGRAGDLAGPVGSAEPAAAAAVRANAADLYLFVWGRRRPGDAGIETSGDPGLLAWWLENAAV